MPMPRKPVPPKACRYCGQEMARKLIGGRLEDRAAFMKRVYCNRACMTASMEGKIKVMNDHNSHRQSCKKVKESCQVCGAVGRMLHVHHADENGMNNDDGNLITLCVPCHRRSHSPNYTDMGQQRKPCLHCERPCCRRGLCGMHLQRLKKYGSPFLTKRRTPSGYVLVNERLS